MRVLAAALIIARRDFVSIVMTPTFLLFLLAPLMMVAFGAIGGISAGQLAQNAGSRERIVAIVPRVEVPAYQAADARLRRVAGGVPRLEILPAETMAAEPQGLATMEGLHDDADVLAVLTGRTAAPEIAERSSGSGAGRYLAALSESIVRQGLGNSALAADQSVARYRLLPTAGPARATQSRLGYIAVFALFMLTLILGGQTVGMLAEEKSNKVIEILAAAVPLESVFFGKLLGMLGVAVLFVGFWVSLIGGGMALAAAQMPADFAGAAALTPAVGWPMFILLGILYFFAAFLLLGAVFLGVGAQASTVREIQMLSLPITLMQVGMFALSTAAANNPGTGIATVAQWLPWSSPFAMAARAATDANLWPHMLALCWQALWIALSVLVAVRLFRMGVLRSGGSDWRWFRRTTASADGDPT